MSWKGAGSLQPPNRGARESRAISDGSEPNELKRDLILSKTAEFHRSECSRIEFFRLFPPPSCSPLLLRFIRAGPTVMSSSFRHGTRRPRKRLIGACSIHPPAP